MEYGKRLRQRLSVTIIRGRVMVMAAAAVAWEKGRCGNSDPEGDLPALPRLNGL
jgi:hypothetical protein